RIPAGVAGVAHAFAGVVELGRSGELGEHAEDLAGRQAGAQYSPKSTHQAAPSRARSAAPVAPCSIAGGSSECATACGSTVFTSAIATMAGSARRGRTG